GAQAGRTGGAAPVRASLGGKNLTGSLFVGGPRELGPLYVAIISGTDPRLLAAGVAMSADGSRPWPLHPVAGLAAVDRTPLPPSRATFSLPRDVPGGVGSWPGTASCRCCCFVDSWFL